MYKPKNNIKQKRRSIFIYQFLSILVKKGKVHLYSSTKTDLNGKGCKFNITPAHYKFIHVYLSHVQCLYLMLRTMY